VIASDIFFNGRSAALARLALLHRLPAVYQVREFPVAGGLMSYGSSFAHRKAA
jgi:putative tryptophan/tyrosine transport system substrate-binding protein